MLTKWCNQMKQGNRLFGNKALPVEIPGRSIGLPERRSTPATAQRYQECEQYPHLSHVHESR